MRMYVLLASMAAAAGCADPLGYCIAEVRAEDTTGNVTDPGFRNPDLVGLTICYTDTVARSRCDELGGTFGDADDWENGADPFCQENGFGTSCGQVFVADEAACPS